MLPVPLYQLECGTNSYDWGKIGHDSAAARFAASTEHSGFQIDPAKPYAELWMGTHPSNPSKAIGTGRTLLELVESNQTLLSAPVAKRYHNQLPFLFKVLSIQKALSIQAHPDKALAERLHASDPAHYPDANHKPEMTIAITPFDGFCGFRPLDQVLSFLTHVPELRTLVGPAAAASFTHTVSDPAAPPDATKAALKALFSAIMTAPPAHFQPLTTALATSAATTATTFAGPHGGPPLAALIARLHSQYPSDIGLFCALLLNHITLVPGEAIFLRANDPHAYLSGDVIECMAASDNVVRAGLTPKFKDVPNLVDMLTYSSAPIEAQKMVPVPWDRGDGEGTTLLYDPPIDEFAVAKTNLTPGASERFAPVLGPSVVICTGGSGTIAVGPKRLEVRTGLVYFVGAMAKVVVEAGEKEGVEVFRAFCEIEEGEEEEE